MVGFKTIKLQCGGQTMVRVGGGYYSHHELLLEIERSIMGDSCNINTQIEKLSKLKTWKT